jgi:site-specific recombinase XerD
MKIEESINKFVESRLNGDSKQAVCNYSHRLSPFVEFCEEHGFENVRDITARRVKQYKKERVNDEYVSPVILEQQLRTFRNFLRWSEDNTPARTGLSEYAEIESALGL